MIGAQVTCDVHLRGACELLDIIIEPATMAGVWANFAQVSHRGVWCTACPQSPWRATLSEMDALDHLLEQARVRRSLPDPQWSEVEFWLTVRSEIPPGALLPVIRGQLAGQEMTAPDVRRQMAALKKRCGLRRRVAPHQFRHGFAVEASREGIPLYSLQGQLGHARLDVTERYLRGIDPMERLKPFADRKPPMIQVPSIYSRT